MLRDDPFSFEDPTQFAQLFTRAVLSRGENAFKAGAVQDLTRKGDRLVARVTGLGGKEHKVIIRALPGGRLGCNCDCDYEFGRCLHAAAALIEHRTYAAQNEDDGPLSGGMRPAELLAWAKEQHLDHWLARPLIQAMPELRGEAGPGLVLIRLDEAITWREGIPQVPRSIQQAAVRWFGALPRDRAVRKAAADARLAQLKAPADPLLASVFTAVKQGLEDLTLGELPSMDEVRAARLSVRPYPTAVVVQSDRPVWCGDSLRRDCRWIVPVALTPTGAPSEAKQTTGTSTCGCATCGLKGVAMAAVALALGGDGDAAIRTGILREAQVPPWQRTLDAVEKVTGEVSRIPEIDGEVAHLAWRIEREKGTKYWALTPAWSRPRRRGKGVLMRPVEPQVLLNAPLQGHVSDGPTVALLAGVDPESPPQAMIYQAIAGLVEHPYVYWRSAGRDRHVAVERADLSISLHPDDMGDSATFAIHLGPESLSDKALSDLKDSCAGGWLIRPAKQLKKGASPAGGADGADGADGGSEEDTLWVAPLAAPAAALIMSLVGRPRTVPAAAVPRILRAWDPVAESMRLTVDGGLKGPAHQPDRRVILRLTLAVRGALRVQFVVRPMKEGVGRIWPCGSGPHELYGVDADGKPFYVPRDLAEEQGAARQLAEFLALEAEGEAAGWRWTLENLEAALTLVSVLRDIENTKADGGTGLPEGAPGIVVEWHSDRRYEVARSAKADDLRVSVGGGRDWFGLQGMIQVDGLEVPLASVLDAIRRGARYVSAGGGQWVPLGEELTRTLGRTARLVEEIDPADLREGEEALRLARVAAPELLGLENAGVTLDGDAAWMKAAKHISESATLEVSLPDGLNAELRDYQHDGFDWLVRHAHWGRGACLADDMGLGKTVQALALLLHRMDLGPALVIAPTSVGFNWLRETARFAPELEVMHYQSRVRQDVELDVGPGSVLITSYDLLTRRRERFEAVEWSTVVLDESQAIKNPDTQRAQACFALNSDFVVALSGTPIENRTGELWSLFNAIAPGLLGTRPTFIQRFARPIERLRDAAVREDLGRLVRPFILRRLKSAVAKELPPRTEVQLDVTLSDAERALYDARRVSALADLRGLGQAAGRGFSALAALTRLRQLACNPRLVDPESTVPSTKLAVLRDLVVTLKAEGHRALVFSQFTSHLALVKPMLEEAGISWRYLDGATPTKQREVEVDAFQGGDGDLFLLSLKAGGTGLNLTAADYVIHLDPWWNPAVEDQATDRTHRLGQTRPVTVYRLVARDTVEEGILKLHADKRELVGALLDGTDAPTPISTEEILSIIANASDPPAP